MGAIGERFGRLTVLAETGYRWLCRCECGDERSFCRFKVKSGHTKSCGCLIIDTSRGLLRTHGMSKSPTHRSWRAMLDRCGRPGNSKYADYGGRGIAVCDRWLIFENFLADMGERPPGLTLERKNNDAGYSPDNCRWATRREQSRNRRDNKLSLEKAHAIVRVGLLAALLYAGGFWG